MANWITLSRFPLLLLIVLMFSFTSPTVRLITVALLVILIIMDSLDGFIARRRGETSLLGSVLDIMADRSVEIVLWVCYAYFDLVPLAIPVIFILRGTVVDALRGMYVSQGQAPFDAMRTKLGRFLVATPLMRSSYGIVKLISFAGLALVHALNAYVAQGSVSLQTVNHTHLLFSVTSWIAVALCLARGIPVIVEAIPKLQAKP